MLRTEYIPVAYLLDSLFYKGIYVVSLELYLYHVLWPSLEGQSRKIFDLFFICLKTSTSAPSEQAKHQFSFDSVIKTIQK